jgi:CHAT domain-containing protein
MASWLRFLGLSSYLNRQRSMEYQEQAAGYYAGIPGVSSAFLAAEYRRLAIFALSMGENERAFRLNELTNQYLARGAANAQKAMITTAALKSAAQAEVDAWSNPVAPPPPDLSKLTPEQQKQMKDVTALVEKFKDIEKNRPQDQLLFSLSTMNEMKKIFKPSDPVYGSRGAGNSLPFMSSTDKVDCSRLDQMSGVWDGLLTTVGINGDIRQNLANISSAGLYFTSAVQRCRSQATAAAGADRTRPGSSKTAAGVPGYALMVRFKGAFTESIAPRKLTVMPGYSKEHEEAVQALPGFQAKANQAVIAGIVLMPPEEQQKIMKLPEEQRAAASSEWWNEHPEKMEEAKKHALRMPEVQNLARDAKLAVGLQHEDLSQGKPLAFLEMFRPHEAFVDVYEYRDIETDRLGAEHYLAVISQAGAPSREVQLGDAQSIDAAVKSFFDALNGGDADLSPAWKALQQMIVRPIVAALPPGAEKVWLSPDSYLSFVPFAALLLDMGSPIRVAVVPSPYDFVRIRQKTSRPAPGGVLFVGDLNYGDKPYYFAPLEQAKTEIDVLSREAAGVRLHTTTLSGSGVTRNAVINQLLQVRFLHFSTHGFLHNPVVTDGEDKTLPGGIALSLANSGVPDAFLTSEDIRHIDLSSAELVTLSACDTGNGKPIEGQGMLGFQTAFMASGTRAVLFSLWKAPANDATTRLMEVFYQGIWKNHLARAEALRQAQTEVRSDPRFADPRNWATWVLVGEGW